MIYGSVCSGIEAPTAAWHPLGWEPAFFSEIEKFPRAVLAHHYPQVPCHGDFTTIQPGQYRAIDLLVGGTPCQDFSIAGKREGLDGTRGNLTLEFVRLARRLRPQWLVWENVPGVFSNNDRRDFGAILACFAGYPEGTAYAPPIDGWRNAGVVPPAGPDGYGLAWRTLDAQYFGVPQRRRRVFVVGYLGDWRPAAAVLLEPESLRGDSPPRRETGARVAGALAGVSPGGGWRTGADEAAAGQLIAFGGNNTSGPIDIATARVGHGGPHGRLDFETETFVTHSLRADGFDASEDGTGRGTPLVPAVLPIDITNSTIGSAGVAGTLERAQSKGNRGQGVIAFNARQDPISDDSGPSGPLDTDGTTQAVAVPILESGKRTGASSITRKAGDGIGQPGDPMFTLGADSRHAIAFDTTQITSKLNRSAPAAGGTGHPLAAGAHAPAVAFSCKDYGADATSDGSPSLRAMGHDKSHANAGGQVAVAYGIGPDAVDRTGEGAAGTAADRAGLNVVENCQPSLRARPNNSVGTAAAVRRLTPRECERLQGFPDNYTLIPLSRAQRKEIEAEMAAYYRRTQPDLSDEIIRRLAKDGPRYKALGNSMAVPCMAWIGRRIEMARAILNDRDLAAEAS